MCVSIVDICASGMRYEFLPPYSPDYNPIEIAFSYIKGVVRHWGDIVQMAMTGPDEVAVYRCLHDAIGLYQQTMPMRGSQSVAIRKTCCFTICNVIND